MTSSAWIETIVLGGSAGALDVLVAILEGLPAGFLTPIVLVLHLPPEKPSYLVSVLEMHSSLAIKEAEDKEPIRPGTLYVAPPNYHVLLERDGTLALSVDQLVHFSRPSIDVLFESAADAYGPRVLGVLLTGANEDGAQGLARIRQAGGDTIVQSPESALVRTMPEAALKERADHHVLAVNAISAYLTQIDAQARSGREMR